MLGRNVCGNVRVKSLCVKGGGGDFGSSVVVWSSCPAGRFPNPQRSGDTRCVRVKLRQSRFRVDAKGNYSQEISYSKTKKAAIGTVTGIPNFTTLMTSRKTQGFCLLDKSCCFQEDLII